MRAFFFSLSPASWLSALLVVGLSPGIALAQSHAAPRPPAAHPAPAKPAPAAASAAPKRIGVFDDWTAATNVEAKQKVCYAFTRAQSSSPTLPGRTDVVLTVTQRASGRDAVALSAGFEYAANATGLLQVDQTKLDLYTAKRSAFARDGHAATVAFGKSAKAEVHSPGPKGDVVDSFSLKGFDRAYAAINKECPAK